MDFDEAGRRYADLRARRQAGQLDSRQFATAVAQLRVQDAQGVWWTLDPDGRWLRWNGSAWVAPPAAAAAGGTRPAGGGARAATSPSRADRATTLRPQAGGAAKTAGLLLSRPQSFWNRVSIVGGLVAGVGYLYYSSLRAAGEGGIDWQGAALMILMPLLLTLFRGPIDALLRPLNGIKARVPRLVLIGAGLITPYVCAYYLYNNNALLQALPQGLRSALYGSYGLIQYEYMRTTLVVGTLLSYAILRMPPKARGGAR